MTFLEGQVKAGPSLLDALGNADIFYEMQYKEVKIVANVSRLLIFQTPPELLVVFPCTKLVFTSLYLP